MAETESNLLSLFLALNQAQETCDDDLEASIASELLQLLSNTTPNPKKQRNSLQNHSSFSFSDVVHSFVIDIEANGSDKKKKKESFRKQMHFSLSLFPLNSVALLNFANFEKDFGDISKAIELYQQVIALKDTEELHITTHIPEETLKEWFDASLEDLFFYSPLQSSISTALTCLALLYQAKHDFEASEVLFQSLNVSHSISNLVWTSLSASDYSSTASTLPQKLRLFSNLISKRYQSSFNHLFRETADFWKLTDYEERGYFSFWYDVKQKPDNEVEHFIQSLITNAKLKGVIPEKLKGVEWWVHKRKSGRNFGHQLHFDTDENTMKAKGELIHPEVSSVFYVSSDEFSGQTVVFDMTPETLREKLGDLENTKAYLCRASEGAGLFFPGDHLHGVLPRLDEHHKSSKNRITLMCGFWTRDLSKIGKRTIFGAASKVPKLTRHNRFWETLQFEEEVNDDENGEIEDVTEKSFQEVSPSWTKVNSHEKQAQFEIDEDIDQRFFFSSIEHFCYSLGVQK